MLISSDFLKKLLPSADPTRCEIALENYYLHGRDEIDRIVKKMVRQHAGVREPFERGYQEGLWFHRQINK